MILYLVLVAACISKRNVWKGDKWQGSVILTCYVKNGVLKDMRTGVKFISEEGYETRHSVLLTNVGHGGGVCSATPRY